jgi:hypothetical protein
MDRSAEGHPLGALYSAPPFGNYTRV